MSPTRILPESGVSCPAIILNKVVLPTPFGPSTPTMPLRGSEKLTSSNSSRSPKPFDMCSTSTTVLPSRGPGGIWISSKSSLRFFSASWAISSYRCSRARLFAWRARGLDRTHSSSSSRRLRRLTSLAPSTLIRAALVSR